MHEQVAEVVKNQMLEYGGYKALLTATPDSHHSHCKCVERVNENRLRGHVELVTADTSWAAQSPAACQRGRRVQTSCAGSQACMMRFISGLPTRSRSSAFSLAAMPSLSHLRASQRCFHSQCEKHTIPKTCTLAAMPGCTPARLAIVDTISPTPSKNG